MEAGREHPQPSVARVCDGALLDPAGWQGFGRVARLVAKLKIQDFERRVAGRETRP